MDEVHVHVRHAVGRSVRLVSDGIDDRLYEEFLVESRTYAAVISRRMSSVISTGLGVVWASPITSIGLIYAATCHVMGWYEWIGRRDAALVWKVRDDAPEWMRSLWEGWGGHAIGNVVVLKHHPDVRPSILVHEQRHVLQCMRLGVFHIPLYALNMLVIRLACPDSHPYYDCSMEIDARRAAGQVTDVVGLMRKK